jgi:PAS domain S-box-containing protein
MKEAGKKQGPIKAQFEGLGLTNERTETPYSNFRIDYEEILDNIGDVFFLLNDKGHFVFIDSFMRQSQGVPLGAFLGLHFLDIIAPNDRERVRRHLQKVMRGEELPPFELEFTAPDGRPLLLECNTRPIYKGNRVIGVKGISRDVTKRKKAEQEVRSLSSSAQEKGEGRGITDLSGDLLYLSEAFASLHGYSTDELTERDLSVLLASGRLTILDRIDQQIRKSGNSVRLPTLARRGGNVFQDLMHGLVIRDEQGKRTGMIDIIRDTGRMKQDGLGRRVREQMKVLETTNVVLAKEKKQRQKAERLLKKREKALKATADDLKEMNTALKLLWRKRDEDKTELEEKMLANMKQLVQPALEKLRATKLDERQKAFMGIMESSLEEIASSFSQRLTSQYSNLSPTELQVANFVKHGKSTKEIAALLNLSTKTIESHREKIRQKLGIKNRRKNLRTHLLSLQ